MSKGTHIRITLTDEQREKLTRLTRTGDAPARVQTRARILLLSDRSGGAAKTEAQAAEALLCSKNTVGNVRRRFAHGGLDAALYERPRPGAAPKITGEAEARLIALACGPPPEGQARWTLRLLADRLVELELVESISDVAVHQRLKKTASSRGR